jgi:hypothetical protein
MFFFAFLASWRDKIHCRDSLLLILARGKNSSDHEHGRAKFFESRSACPNLIARLSQVKLDPRRYFVHELLGFHQRGFREPVVGKAAIAIEGLVKLIGNKQFVKFYS